MTPISRLKLACLATSLLAPVAAHAQTVPNTPDPSALSEVVVTGSRLVTNTNSPTPVTTVQTQSLEQITPSNLPAALNKLPVFIGSQSSDNRTLGGSANASGASLNLRNFGVQRTLVLLDGQRLAPNNSNGTVNTDIIPEMLVERVDVVTGGASAVYGSDAVTGVVNFILNKNFNGLKYDAGAGTSNSGVGTQYHAGIAAGAALLDNRAHIEGAFRYFNQDQVLASELPYGKNGQAYALAGNGTAVSPYFVVSEARLNSQPFGGLISCGGCSANGQTFVQNGVLGPYSAGAFTSAATPSLSSGGTGRVDLAPGVQAALNTYQAFGRFSYELSNTVTAYAQFRAGEAVYFNNGPNNGLPPGTGAAARPNMFYTDNPFLTPQVQAALNAGNTTSVTAPDGTVHKTFNFVNYQGGLTGTSPLLGKLGNQPIFGYESTDRNVSGSAGLEGTFRNRFKWNLNYSHDENTGTTENPANTNFQKLYASQDAVKLTNGTVACYVSTTQYASLYPGCVPSNPFGQNSLSADAYAYYNTPTKFVMTNKMDNIEGNVSGEVFEAPAGPVKLALSGEYRTMTYQIVSNAQPGSVNCTGLRLCSTAAPLWFQTTVANASAKENVWETAAEINVPLLKNLPFLQDLSVDAAARYTDYSVSGSAPTWKVGLDYHLNPLFRVRATASTDIRAPTLNDLFAPAGQAVSPLTDLYTGKSADTVAISRGNPNLLPERANTYTAGIVLTPPNIRNLSLSVDYYKITLLDAITSISYTTPAVQQLCITAVKSGGTSPYCALATRPLPIASDSSAANFPTSITTLSLNSAVQQTEGVDIELNYRAPLESLKLPGSVSLRSLFSYQPYITTVAFQGSAPTITAMPHVRVTSFAGYEIGDWNLNIEDRWLSSYKQATFPGQMFVQSSIASYNQVDLTIDKTFWAKSSAPLHIYLSVQNVFNSLYPLAPSTNSTSNPGLFYPVPTGWGDILGRFWTVGLRQTF